MHRSKQSLSHIAKVLPRRATPSAAASTPRAVATIFSSSARAPATIVGRQGATAAAISSFSPISSTLPQRCYSSSSTKTQTMGAPEMDSSLDQIVPKSLFEGEGAALSEPLARQVVEIVLTQLRQGVDAKAPGEVASLSKKADEQVREVLEKASVTAASLQQFVTRMLRLSKDPRRMPIAFRLFGIAFGVDPLEMKDPTAPTSALSGLDSTLSSVPIAGEGKFGSNAAGYNWASMVLSGQSPPPAGIHLIERGSTEYIEAIRKQQAAAVRVYATLAMRGDPQGMLGMGRVLMAGTQREVPVPGKTGAEAEKEVQMMKDRTIALWTKAGQLGISDAWFELGLLFLGTNSKSMTEADEAKARSYFDMGAKEGNLRCHHALGVMHTQAALADNQSPSTPERLENLNKSLQHFTSAAEMGDPQSAHNLGLRYLLRDEMVDEIALGKEEDGRTDEQVMEQARKRHSNLWGVEANDVEARKWFAKAAEFGSIPAMMNFAGMLVEARGKTDSPAAAVGSIGSQEDAAKALILSRLEDLKKAESLYSKVAAHGSVLAQQQQQPPKPQQTASSAPPSSSKENVKTDQAKGPQEVDVAKEMTDFAQGALGTVQSMIVQLLEQVDKIEKQKPSSSPPNSS